MSAPPPPPPPPHGEVPKSSGLPPGKYDIFVIPEHSAGSGFLYLPSLQPNVNSFAAGFASALILVAVFQSMAPAFRTWWENFQGLGNMGFMLLIVGVGFGAWALGRTQKDGAAGGPRHQSSGGHHGSGSHHGGQGFGSSAGSAGGNGGPPPPPHGGSPPPPNDPPPQNTPPPPPPPGQDKPKSSWQRPPQPGATRTGSPKPERAQKPENPKGSWEKARDEMRKKEEERKAKEAEQKRRDEAARRLAELRAKDAKERQEREKDRQRKEAEQKVRDGAAKLEREKKEREAKQAREAKEAKEKEDKKKAEEAAQKTRMGSSYAFSGVGEKTSMWPNGRPPVPSHAGNSSPTPKPPPSPPKRPPAPTAKTYLGTDEDGYSFRPYDQPKRGRKMSAGSYMESESSWAPSHTTARTSPPRSFRGPYSTKDPDKIVIHAVYLFMNQFAKTPASQLVSGVGSVTDGLILRITTEGLFIDDDVRGVPQREWDVKAWTLKAVEVWCPPHCLNASATSASSPTPGAKNASGLFSKMAGSRARNADRDGNKALTGEEADTYLNEMLRACKDCCRLGLCDRKFKDTNIGSSSAGQTGEWKSKGLHVLRATIRDQEGKRYLFVVDETEGWKVAAGLQRLKRGTQVRQLGVGSMPASDARGILETLGWSG